MGIRQPSSGRSSFDFERHTPTNSPLHLLALCEKMHLNQIPNRVKVSESSRTFILCFFNQHSPDISDSLPKGCGVTDILFPFHEALSFTHCPISTRHNLWPRRFDNTRIALLISRGHAPSSQYLLGIGFSKQRKKGNNVGLP